MPAPAFILARFGESGLHGLIPGPQREYALRNFKVSGFGGGELSWERREETGYWRDAAAKRNPTGKVCVVNHKLSREFPVDN